MLLPANHEQLAALGAAVQARREAAGVTLAALGERTRLGVEKVSTIERGERVLTLLEVVSVARALRVDAAQLFREAEATERRRRASRFHIVRD